ncbi:MAG: lasso RiPP family leader peptide-containing protein [Gammaproteobacteria bacterium]|nr:lasso RiPP family leader peptide-containing protein [Gammaproteobacteria bacterium]
MKESIIVNQKVGNNRKKQSRKKPYQAPVLEKYGKLSELVQGGGGFPLDLVVSGDQPT